MLSGNPLFMNDSQCVVYIMITFLHLKCALLSTRSLSFFFFTAHQSWLILNFHVSCDAFIFFFFYTSAAFSQRSKQRLSKELSDCVVYCKSVHFRSFKHSRIHSKFYEVTSFTESKARKHLREAGKSSLTESHSFLGRTLHVFTTENYLGGNAAELLWVNFPSKHYASASRIQCSNVCL